MPHDFELHKFCFLKYFEAVAVNIFWIGKDLIEQSRIVFICLNVKVIVERN